MIDPAATLRAAAERLRELAGAVATDVGDEESWYESGPDSYLPRSMPQPDRELIAAMSPPVALAVADWLDETVAEAEAMGGMAAFVHDPGPGALDPSRALAVARRVLGEAT